MTQQEYTQLSKELQTMSKQIPAQWGRIQNNSTDRKINMFSAKNVAQLEQKIKRLNDADKNYFRRRWFLWQCARVDEYLFYSLPNVTKNPNFKDKSWDIEFTKQQLQFDIKGTVVPKALQSNFSIKEEQNLINFYYQQQSKGVRFGLQNRLFIVHHSFYKPERPTNHS